MSMSVSAYSSLSGRKGTGGLASGLDTQELIKQMTAGTTNKITSKLQQRQIAIWKRDAYREVSSKLVAFSNKYFSYTNSASKSNILSREFFNVSKITSSSSNVVLTGDSNIAKNIQIQEIKELASTAGFTSGHQVSSQKLESGLIHSTWTENSIKGAEIKISYGGKTHSVQLDSNFYLDSYAAPGEDIGKVIAELNKKIEANSDIKGKLEFSLDTITNKVSLKQIGENKTNDLRVESGNINLLTGLGMHISPKAEEGQTAPVFSQIDGTETIRESAFFENNLLVNSSLALQVNGKIAFLSLDKDFRFSADALNDEVKMREELQNAYNDVISKNDSLKDTLSTTVNADNTVTFSALPKDGVQTIKILGGNEELLKGLGLKVTPSDQPDTSSVTGTAMQKDSLLFKDNKTLSEVLAGTNLSVSLNGISKKISFNESDKGLYSDPAKLASYVQSQLDTLYGQDRLFVSENAGKLSFSTVQKDSNGNIIKGDANSIFIVQNSDASGVMGENAALKMIVGESNRAEYIKTLDQIKGDLATTLIAGTEGEYAGKYALNVNGKVYTFDKDTMLGDVISRINNDPESNVVISYSSITDVFSVKSKESGAHGKVEISDVTGGGNLAQVLFGTKDTDYTVSPGKDLEMQISFDGGNTFTTVKRSDNNFSIDGVNFEIKGKISEKVTFNAESNTDDLVKKITDFVKDYNDVVDLMNGKLSEKRYGRTNEDDDQIYLPLTDEQKKEMSESEVKTWEEKAKMGLLQNDSSVYKILSNLRWSAFDSVGLNKDSLNQIGIAAKPYAYNENGKLYIDEDKLKKALVEDSEKVIGIFTNAENGVSTRMKKVLQDAVGMTGNSGLLFEIAGRENSIAPDQSSLSRNISDITDQLKTLKVRLQDQEDRYWAQFTRLEKYISVMNQQSSWLTQQFSS